MKLDYSEKDGNWHIHTPDGASIRPSKAQLSLAAVSVAVAGFVVLIALILGGVYVYHHLSQPTAPTIVEAPQDTAIQTVTIALPPPTTQS